MTGGLLLLLLLGVVLPLIHLPQDGRGAGKRCPSGWRG